MPAATPASPLSDSRIVLRVAALEEADPALGYEAALPYLLVRRTADEDAPAPMGDASAQR